MCLHLCLHHMIYYWLIKFFLTNPNVKKVSHVKLEVFDFSLESHISVPCYTNSRNCHFLNIALKAL